MAGSGHIQLVGYGHAFGVVQQSDDQKRGHALTIADEQHVPAERQVGAFHQGLEVLGRLTGKAYEVLLLIHQLLQPAAERVGATFFVEVAPGLVGLAVVGLDQAGQQLLQCFGAGQLGVTQGQAGRVAVGLFVNLMNDAVVDGHGTIRNHSGRPCRPVSGRVRWGYRLAIRARCSLS